MRLVIKLATLMASIREWTAEKVPDHPDLEKLAQTVEDARWPETHQDGLVVCRMTDVGNLLHEGPGTVVGRGNRMRLARSSAATSNTSTRMWRER